MEIDRGMMRLVANGVATDSQLLLSQKIENHAPCRVAMAKIEDEEGTS